MPATTPERPATFPEPQTYDCAEGSDKRISTTWRMPGWEIALVTSKSSNGGLYTTLSAAIIDGGFRYFRMYKDYMNTIRRDPQMRATAKNLRALHDSALAECTPEKLASIPVPDPR